MGANHLDNIIITIALAAVPAGRAGFYPLLLVDEADGTGNDLGGDRFVEYTSYNAALSDSATSGFMTAATLEAIRVMFAQTNKPRKVFVGRVDTGAGTPETYQGALDLVIAAGADFYGVCIDKRTDTEILAVSAAIEAHSKPMLFVLQSDDADWLTTGGYPAALTALESRERTVIAYHTTDAQWMDAAWLADRLGFDPDTISVPWNCPLKEVAAMSSLPTDTQKGFLDANEANHGLPLGASTFYVDPGRNANDRPIYQMASRDWLYIRLQEDLAALIIEATTAGQKIGINTTGQALVQARLETRLALGVGARHFEEFSVVAEAITAADITAERLRFTVDAKFENSARVLSLTVNLGTSDLE